MTSAARARVENALCEYRKHPVDGGKSAEREAWRLTAAYCRRHGIETLRADYEFRPNEEDRWRATTARDVANRHHTQFRVKS